jgi:hypothetical protein
MGRLRGAEPLFLYYFPLSWKERGIKGGEVMFRKVTKTKRK